MINRWPFPVPPHPSPSHRPVYVVNIRFYHSINMEVLYSSFSTLDTLVNFTRMYITFSNIHCYFQKLSDNCLCLRYIYLMRVDGVNNQILFSFLAVI